MTDRKPRSMANTREFRETAKRIGRAIERIRKQRGKSQAEVGAAYYGSGVDAIRKIEAGTSGSDGFVKLLKLAEILQSTPNDLLEVRDSSEEAIRGLLEGIALAFDRPLEQAAPLAEILLKVLNSPDIRNTGIPLRDSARSVGSFEARQFLRKEKP